jgi:hypothetical protein
MAWNPNIPGEPPLGNPEHSGRTPLASDPEPDHSVDPADLPSTPKEHETMLDVHPAHHAATNWRDFFIHIATIVIGLLIAIALEQTVEYVHHRRQVADVREELRGEREANKHAFENETANWRWETAELQNNLLVLGYLQQHPGTPDENLPGTLIWSHASAPNTQAAWDAARNSGVISLLSREEIEQYDDTYNKLRRIDDARSLAFDAMIEASRYELMDSRLSHLNPAQIAELTTLTQTALTRHWIEGVALENTARIFKDFPPSITSSELSRIRHRQALSQEMHDPAYALTITRMKAAGFVP